MRELLSEGWRYFQRIGIELLPLVLAFGIVVLIYQGVFSLGNVVHVKDEKQKQKKAEEQKLDSTRQELTVAAEKYVKGDSSARRMAGDSLLKLIRVRVKEEMAQRTVKADERNAKAVVSNIVFWEQFPWYVPIIAFLMFGALFWAYLYYKQHNVAHNEQDPPMLTRLLAEKAGDMRELKTPRKIKRFINKIRLQFFLYAEDRTNGIIQQVNLEDWDTAQDFFYLLLAIENDDIELKDDLQFAQAALQMRPGANLGLVSNIYEFNKDIIM